jgi:hypothetical protein
MHNFIGVFANYSFPAFFSLVGVTFKLGFMLPRQVLYLLRHTSSPFFSGYFEMQSLELFALGGLEPRSSRSQAPKWLG